MDPTSFRLDGKVAVVVGGTGVLCAHIAGTLATAGANVVIVGRDVDKANAVLNSLRHDGNEVTFERCDVSERSELVSLVDRVRAARGRIDVLVNDAGRFITGAEIVVDGGFHAMTV